MSFNPQKTKMIHEGEHVFLVYRYSDMMPHDLARASLQ